MYSSRYSCGPLRILRPGICNIGGLFIALVALILLAACGGGASSTQSSTSSNQGSKNTPTGITGISSYSIKSGIDACMLVSKDRASQVLGGVAEVKPANFLPDCIYRFSSHQLLTTVGTSESPKEYYDLAKAQAIHPLDISGLGDAAFYSPRVISGNITVLIGKAVFSISLTNQETKADNREATLKDLAKDAVSVVSSALPTLVAPKPDPCAVVTKDEVTRVLGETQVQMLNGVNGKGVMSCTLLTSKDRSMFIDLIAHTNSQDARSTYDKMKAPNAKTVNGIGDAAFSNGPGKIDVLKGNYYFGIAVSSKTGLNNAVTLEHLAQSAAGRI